MNKFKTAATPSSRKPAQELVMAELLHSIGELKQALFAKFKTLTPTTRLLAFCQQIPNTINEVLKKYKLPPCTFIQIKEVDGKKTLTIPTPTGKEGELKDITYVIHSSIGKGANGDVLSLSLEGSQVQLYALKTRRLPFNKLTQQTPQQDYGRGADLELDSDASDASVEASAIEDTGATALRELSFHDKLVISPSISIEGATIQVDIKVTEDPEKSLFKKIFRKNTPTIQAVYTKAAHQPIPSAVSAAVFTAESFGSAVLEYVLMSLLSESCALLPPQPLVMMYEAPSKGASCLLGLGLVTDLANGGSVDTHIPLLAPPLRRESSPVEDPLISKLQKLVPEELHAQIPEWATIFRNNTRFLILKCVKGLFEQEISFRDLKPENIVFKVTQEPGEKPVFQIKVIDPESLNVLGPVAKVGGSFSTVPPESAASLLTTACQRSMPSLRRMLSDRSLLNLSMDVFENQSTTTTGAGAGIFALGAVFFILDQGHSLYFSEGHEPGQNPKWLKDFAQHVHTLLEGKDSIMEGCPAYIRALTQKDPQARVAWFKEFVVDGRDDESLKELAWAHQAMDEMPAPIANAFADIFIVHKPLQQDPASQREDPLGQLHPTAAPQLAAALIGRRDSNEDESDVFEAPRTANPIPVLLAMPKALLRLGGSASSSRQSSLPSIAEIEGSPPPPRAASSSSRPRPDNQQSEPS